MFANLENVYDNVFTEQKNYLCKDQNSSLIYVWILFVSILPENILHAFYFYYHIILNRSLTLMPGILAIICINMFREHAQDRLRPRAMVSVTQIL